MIGLVATLVALFTSSNIEHEFVYNATIPHKAVTVAGSFNNWDKMATPLKVDSDGRTWRKRIRIQTGKHFYKFVLDGETWITDPNAIKNEDDGNGNVNSVLLILPPDYRQAAASGDGKITRSPIRHVIGVPDVNFDRGVLTLRISVRPNDVQKVRVRASGKLYETRRLSMDEFFEVREASIPWRRDRKLEYRFLLDDGPESLQFGPHGLSPTPLSNFELDPDTYKPFEVPEWVARTVFYQIFPDRFANGDKNNDPPDVVPWAGEPKYFNFMGGDLAGVRAHVPYLAKLGVSGVYFNPIFRSPSNHGYETSDYLEVEPRFGTNSEFVGLVQNLRKGGIRTVLDGVFNHTAVDFAPFVDLRARGEASAYKEWYFPKSFPIVIQENPNYEAWYGFPSMPKLNVLNPQVESYLLGVLDFWHTAARLDGWRLDVANEVDERFWRKFRSHLKSRAGNDKWILGEVWGDGSRWLQGDQWDSVMNYQFRDATLRYVARGQSEPAQYLDRLMQVYSSYAPQVSRNLLNLLGSHDTPRFLHECGGDERLARLGATLLMTWVGAPSIYYGDELGMTGGPDPDNRRGMRWDLASDSNSTLQHYRRLTKIRNAVPALQDGDPVRLTSSNDRVLVFGRHWQNSSAIVVINRTAEVQKVSVDLTKPMASNFKSGSVEALKLKPTPLNSQNQISLSLEPLSGAVIVPADQLESSFPRSTQVVKS